MSTTTVDLAQELKVSMDTLFRASEDARVPMTLARPLTRVDSYPVYVIEPEEETLLRQQIQRDRDRRTAEVVHYTKTPEHLRDDVPDFFRGY